MAMAMAVLVAFTGLAIDGSNFYYQQQRMQVAADAAVLAGGRELALVEVPAEAKSAAQTQAEMIALLNGADADDIAITVTADGQEIRVTTGHTFDTFFARMIGHDTLTARASAGAGTIVVGRAGNLLPLITRCPAEGFVYGQEYNLREIDLEEDDEESPNHLHAPGNFGWITWDGDTSTPTLANNIANPANSLVWEIGDEIPATPGTRPASSVRDALNDLIEEGKTVTMPLFDEVDGSGSNTRYRVCGFAQFVLTGHNLPSNPAIITGRFVRNVTSGEAFADAPDHGTRDVRMLE